MKAPLIISSLAFLLATSAFAEKEKVEICHRTGSEKSPAVSLEVSPSAVEAHLAHGDSLGSCDCNAIPLDVMICGGIAGIPCPAGSACLDDPRDGCDPAGGGADCSGICVVPLTDSNPDVCPAGFVQIDDESDDCNPECGDVDCPILCVATNGAICEGFAGFMCRSYSDFLDCGETLEGCHVDCGGADCAGSCVNLAISPQVVCETGDCCPEGSICLDGLCWIPIIDDGIRTPRPPGPESPTARARATARPVSKPSLPCRGPVEDV